MAGACLALPGASLALPAAGGAGLTPAPSHPRQARHSRATAPAQPPVVAQPATATVSASGGGITVQTSASGLLRRQLTFTGTAPGDAGKTVEIERRGVKTAWQWAPTTSATVQADGSFSAPWTVDHIGRFQVRAVLESSLAEPAGATSVMTVTLYLPSRASWYGLFGHSTACGYKLTRSTLGVANKTLTCGESVALYYRGRSLVVPVIDRGPYIKGRRYDLTYATARALRLLRRGVATIGAVSLPSTP